MWDFIVVVFWVVVIPLTFIAFVVLRGYNALRRLAEEISEAWSNIGVSARKQVSLIKQLIEVVKGYQDSEKLVMLQVSDDMSSASAVANLHQQAGLVMSSVSGLAQRFPELKANEQYQRLITSIQECESTLERARQHYNGSVKAYNQRRSSVPHVFYASTLGFKAASYLEFDGNNEQGEVGALAIFASDADGEQLNRLIGAAGAKAKRLGEKAMTGSVSMANKAIAGGKVLAESAKEKADEFKQSLEEKARQAAATAAASAPGSAVPHASTQTGPTSNPAPDNKN